MARPIEATPVLDGEDAERLLRDLARAMLREGLESARTGEFHDLGSFAQFADDD